MKNRKFGDKLICVEMLNGEIKRIISHDAHFLIVGGDAKRYCSKTEYFKYIERPERTKSVTGETDELGEIKPKKKKKNKSY